MSTLHASSIGAIGWAHSNQYLVTTALDVRVSWSQSHCTLTRLGVLPFTPGMFTPDLVQVPDTLTFAPTLYPHPDYQMGAIPHCGRRFMASSMYSISACIMPSYRAKL